MMNSLYTLLGAGVVLALAVAFARQVLDARRAKSMAARQLFAEVGRLLEDFELKPGDTAGSWKATGRYGNELFQYHVVADTLAARKLPSLWLLLTLPKPQPVKATIDVMMRPAAHSTFSQFDFLPHTIAPPADFPAEAVVRSDHPGVLLPAREMALAYPVLGGRGGKELLLSPRGLRIVVQAAEADRLRYGVFREARFEGAVIDGARARSIMDTLLAIDAAFRDTA